MTNEQIKDIFSYHAPKPEQVAKYNAVNQAFQDCALAINEQMPDGAGKTVAFRKLSEARMATNAAIALEGRF